jgi:hypothetical protein
MCAVASPAAQANSASYCGYLIPSSTDYSPGHACSSAAFTSWTFTSAQYTGSGTISNLCTVMAHNGTRALFQWEGCARPGSYASICYWGYLGSDYGLLRQNDHGGPNHTIYGVVNDGSYSGCFYEPAPV